jgi:hypothetical protein
MGQFDHVGKPKWIAGPVCESHRNYWRWRGLALLVQIGIVSLLFCHIVCLFLWSSAADFLGELILFPWFLCVCFFYLGSVVSIFILRLTTISAYRFKKVGPDTVLVTKVAPEFCEAYRVFLNSKPVLRQEPPINSGPPSVALSAEATHVLKIAQDEARGQNEDYVGTVHLLLALGSNETELAAFILKNLSIETASIRQSIELFNPAQLGPARSGALPRSPRLEKVLARSWEHAQRLHRVSVEPTHLLLALLQDREDLAAQALMDNGLDLDQAVYKVEHLIGGPPAISSMQEEPSGSAS